MCPFFASGRQPITQNPQDTVEPDLAEYKPEKVVYICANPEDCPRGSRRPPYYRGNYKPSYDNVPPLTITTETMLVS